MCHHCIMTDLHIIDLYNASHHSYVVAIILKSRMIALGTVIYTCAIQYNLLLFRCCYQYCCITFARHVATDSLSAAIINFSYVPPPMFQEVQTAVTPPTWAMVDPPPPLLSFGAHFHVHPGLPYATRLQ